MINGKTIAITRSEEDASEFIELVQQNNAKPIPLPTIELVSKGEMIVDEFLESIKNYDPDYSVFMSSKAVKLLFDTAKQIGKLEKLQLAVANTMVMSVGPKTTNALESEGIKVNFQPTTYSSVGVGEEFTRIHAVGKKVIVVENLKPAKLMGQESRGMILAVENADGKLEVLTVNKNVKNGTKVS
jgi:uroporphyrinogen-III synthase